METLLANRVAAVRKETLDGRDYLVVPLSMIVPGVLNGSKGPLHYPPEEIGRYPTAWNGMPIVVNHPNDEQGNPVSARSPKVYEQFGIGHVYEAKVTNGRLTAEGWIDVTKAEKVNRAIVNTLRAGKSLELSTGLFTDNEPKTGTFNGRAYTHIARNYRPDHLAILPDTIGACSVKDGCGVLVNDGGCGTGAGGFKPGNKCAKGGGAGSTKLKVGKETKNSYGDGTSEVTVGGHQIAEIKTRNVGSTHSAGYRREYSVIFKTEGLKAATGKNVRAVGKSGSERVEGVTDFASSSFDSKSSALGYVKKKLGDVGLTANKAGCQCAKCKAKKRKEEEPETLETNNRRADMTKEQMIETLVANCSCDEVRNRAIESYQEMDDDVLEALTANAEAPEEEEEEEPVVPKKKAKAKPFVKNTVAPVPATLTDAEWLAKAPAGIRSVVQNAMAFEQAQRGQYIDQIVANAKNPFTKEYLATQPLEVLKGLATLAGSAQPTANTGILLPNYYGAAGAPVQNLGKDFANEDQDMVPPVINWAEEAAKRRSA